jgi:hypothetical protein
LYTAKTIITFFENYTIIFIFLSFRKIVPSIKIAPHLEPLLQKNVCSAADALSAKLPPVQYASRETPNSGNNLSKFLLYIPLCSDKMILISKRKRISPTVRASTKLKALLRQCCSQLVKKC